MYKFFTSFGMSLGHDASSETTNTTVSTMNATVVDLQPMTAKVAAHKTIKNSEAINIPVNNNNNNRNGLHSNNNRNRRSTSKGRVAKIDDPNDGSSDTDDFNSFISKGPQRRSSLDVVQGPPISNSSTKEITKLFLEWDQIQNSISQLESQLTSQRSSQKRIFEQLRKLIPQSLPKDQPPPIRRPPTNRDLGKFINNNNNNHQPLKPSSRSTTTFPPPSLTNNNGTWTQLQFDPTCRECCDENKSNHNKPRLQLPAHPPSLPLLSLPTSQTVTNSVEMITTSGVTETPAAAPAPIATPTPQSLQAIPAVIPHADIATIASTTTTPTTLLKVEETALQPPPLPPTSATAQTVSIYINGNGNSRNHISITTAADANLSGTDQKNEMVVDDKNLISPSICPRKKEVKHIMIVSRGHHDQSTHRMQEILNRVSKVDSTYEFSFVVESDEKTSCAAILVFANLRVQETRDMESNTVNNTYFSKVKTKLKKMKSCLIFTTPSEFGKTSPVGVSGDVSANHMITFRFRAEQDCSLHSNTSESRLVDLVNWLEKV